MQNMTVEDASTAAHKVPLAGDEWVMVSMVLGVTDDVPAVDARPSVIINKGKVIRHPRYLTWHANCNQPMAA